MGRGLPVEAKHRVFEKFPGGGPVCGLQLQAAQGDIPQARGQLRGDGGSRCGTCNLEDGEVWLC